MAHLARAPGWPWEPRRETRGPGRLLAGSWARAPGALQVGNDIDRQEKRDRDFQQAVATTGAQAQQQRVGVFDVIRLSQNGMGKTFRPHHQPDPQHGKHVPN